MKKDQKFNLAMLTIGMLMAILLLATSCSSTRKIERQAVQLVPARDYQISIGAKWLNLWDGNRFVGRIPFEEGKEDSTGRLILRDNL